MKYKMEQDIRNGLLYMLAFALAVVLLAQVSTASLDGYGTKQVNKQFTFCQVCSDATYITLSSIETPNSTIQINSNMTAQGTGQFCYNYTPTLIGRYDFRGISNGCTGEFATYIDVTYTGTEFEIQQSYIYFVSLLILVLGAIGLWFIRSNISGEHGRSESGAITLINFKGFLRPVLLTGIWIIVLVCIFIISNLGLAFLPNPMIGQLFLAIYKVLFWMTIIAVPVGFVFMLVKIVKSLELQKMIERGVEVRENKL